MRPARLNMTVVKRSAMKLIDREGVDALTLSAVAGHLGVGPSALYTHVDGLDGLRYLVAVAATDNLTNRVRNAAIGNSGNEALSAMGAAYREFALEHPGQFASILTPPTADDDVLATSHRALTDVFALVFTAMGLDPEESRRAAHGTRSAIHGFLALEYMTGTSDQHESDYTYLLETIQRGLATRAS